jgi:SAM-dependent methyltransferase
MRRSGTADDSPLPEPVVSPGAYDAEYYLHACGGSEEWRASDGREVAPVYEWALKMAGFRSHDVVVDIGTGRGELLALAARSGADRAIGVEYSPAAVELARRTIAVHGAEQRAEVILADARAIPVEDHAADLVFLLDVVEHLSPSELDDALAEALRLLRPGGRLLIHTMPNATIYAVTYRLQRLLSRRRRREWPRDPRNDHERLMHVNEQTVTTLRRSLRRAGFRPAKVWLGEWIYTDFISEERAKNLYHRLAAHRPTARLGRGDLWADAVRPG